MTPLTLERELTIDLARNVATKPKPGTVRPSSAGFGRGGEWKPPVIEYDHRNLMASVVGRANGLADSELERLLSGGGRHVEAVRRGWESGELGFLELPDGGEHVVAIQRFADSRRGTFETVLLLGIGGSALGAEALDWALRQFGRTQRAPELRVIDNPDPSNVLRQMAGLVPGKTLTLVISKSGGTLETLAALALVDQWYAANSCDRARHIVIVTGPSGGKLNTYADMHRLTRFAVPENVGGRFSVLSSVGLLPAALLGYDIHAMLDGAKRERDSSFAAGGSRRNGPLLAAAAHASLCESYGKTASVLMPYHSRLKRFGAWYVQLWAESLGKERRRSGRVSPTGQTAISITGPQAQHSQLQLFLDGPNDKIVTLFGVRKFETEIPLPEGFDYESLGLSFLRGKDFADIIHGQIAGTQAALCQKLRPNAMLTVDELSERELGALFMFFELQTAYAAEFLDVNAYDQPAVEIGKKVTRERLGGA